MDGHDVGMDWLYNLLFRPQKVVIIDHWFLGIFVIYEWYNEMVYCPIVHWTFWVSMVSDPWESTDINEYSFSGFFAC